MKRLAILFSLLLIWTAAPALAGEPVAACDEPVTEAESERVRSDGLTRIEYRDTIDRWRGGSRLRANQDVFRRDVLDKSLPPVDLFRGAGARGF